MPFPLARGLDQAPHLSIPTPLAQVGRDSLSGVGFTRKCCRTQLGGAPSGSFSSLFQATLCQSLYESALQTHEDDQHRQDHHDGAG